jgi:hypothetical protein
VHGHRETVRSHRSNCNTRSYNCLTLDMPTQRVTCSTA